MIQKMPDPVVGSQERSLARSHDGVLVQRGDLVSVLGSAEFVSVDHTSAINKRDDPCADPVDHDRRCLCDWQARP